MDQEEELLREHKFRRQELENQEDDIKDLERTTQQIASEAYSELRFTLSDISESVDSLNEARIELAHLEEDVLDQLSYEKKKVQEQKDDNEDYYRRELKKLREAD